MDILKKGKIVGTIDDDGARTNDPELREILENVAQIRTEYVGDLQVLLGVPISSDEPGYIDALRGNLAFEGYTLER